MSAEYPNRFLVFIPCFLLLHNIEEALTMPQWIETHLPVLREKVPLFRLLEFSPVQLYISLTLVTVVPAIVAWSCLKREATPRGTAVMLILQSVIFWNALVPHAAGLWVLGIYNPGTITALAVNIPYTLVLFRSVRTRSALSIPAILSIGAVIYLPLVYANHLLAKFLARLL